MPMKTGWLLLHRIMAELLPAQLDLTAEHLMKNAIFLPSSIIRISLRLKLKNRLTLQHLLLVNLPILILIAFMLQQIMRFTISELQVLLLSAE